MSGAPYTSLPANSRLLLTSPRSSLEGVSLMSPGFQSNLVAERCFAASLNSVIASEGFSANKVIDEASVPNSSKCEALLGMRRQRERKSYPSLRWYTTAHKAKLASSVCAARSVSASGFALSGGKCRRRSAINERTVMSIASCWIRLSPKRIEWNWRKRQHYFSP